jgi:hypothetical protein
METPKLTRIDFIENGNKKRVSGFANTRIVNHGRWKQDGVPGKMLCLIEITIPELGVVINFTPAESFQDELLVSWLDAERQNDTFVFKTPRYDRTRPTMLKTKLSHLHKLLDDYPNDARQRLDGQGPLL